MTWPLVSSGSFVNIDYETRECGGEYLHLVKALGPIGREERIPLVNEILKITRSENYFAILDNRRGYENSLSLEDMSFLGDILYDAGIRRFYNAVVTSDDAYSSNVKLMNAVAATKHVETETLSTNDYDDAENFILEKMKKFMKPQ